MKILLALIVFSSLSFAQLYSSPSDNHSMTNMSKKEAKDAFNSINTSTKPKAECYNKAYVWSYYMKQNFNVDSNKLFIFYTSKYLTELGGMWSYHVAPLVMVDGQKSVFDKTFWHSSTKQLSPQSWVDVLMKVDNRKLETLRRKLVNKKKLLAKKLRNRRYADQHMALQAEMDAVEKEMVYYQLDMRQKMNITCPLVKNISEIENTKAQNSEYCYLIESSMYYKDPVDLRLFENQGFIMTEFNHYDLKKAKKQAFNSWRDLN